MGNHIACDHSKEEPIHVGQQLGECRVCGLLVPLTSATAIRLDPPPVVCGVQDGIWQAASTTDAKHGELIMHGSTTK